MNPIDLNLGKNYFMKNKKTWIIIVAVLVVFWFIGTFGNNKKTAEKEVAKTGNLELNSKAIPGSVPVDVYQNFEDKGYKIDKQSGSDYNIWECTKKESGIDYDVKVGSSTTDNIEMVRGSASLDGSEKKSPEAMKPFISYVASLQYTGNDLPKLHQWIDDNFNKKTATIIIGGVKFSLYAPSPFMRMIQYEKA